MGDRGFAEGDHFRLVERRAAHHRPGVTSAEGGPGKLFETEEEEFAEYIEMMEWTTQVTPEGFDRFHAALLTGQMKENGSTFFASGRLRGCKR